MKKYINFKFEKINFLAFIVLALTIIWVKFFNITEIQENTIYENIAVLPLLLGIILCLKCKNYKVFFRFLSLILFLALAREFSYGRVPFCAIEGSQGHEFYPWSYYKYGFLANIFVGTYIVFSIIYAIINKIWNDIIEIFQRVQIPFWSFFITFICIAIQEISEHSFENTVVEETVEFMIYCLTYGIIWIYYKKIK